VQRGRVDVAGPHKVFTRRGHDGGCVLGGGWVVCCVGLPGCGSLVSTPHNQSAPRRVTTSRVRVWHCGEAGARLTCVCCWWWWWWCVLENATLCVSPAHAMQQWFSACHTPIPACAMNACLVRASRVRVCSWRGRRAGGVNPPPAPPHNWLGCQPR
jgi:hypothetical protein